jgi:hypothetical protein
MKLRHSTICTLYSSTKFEALVRTKCIRRNMRSTCQWSCVLQFTWRRAVCCGLHRPMSQVILCLGLKFIQFVFNFCYTWYQLMCLQHTMWCVPLMHRYSELPWRNPLETNNISYEAYDSRMRVPRILYISLSLHHKMESRMANMMSVYTLMILPQVHLRKPCYDF